MRPNIVTGYRTSVIAVMAGFFVLLGLATAYKDATGSGLAESMYYHVFGDAIYPFFYGGLAAVLYGHFAMYRRSRAFISVSDGALVVGHRHIALENLHRVETEKNVFGLRKIVFRLADGRQFSILASVLSEPVENVVAMLQAISSRQSDPGQ